MGYDVIVVGGGPAGLAAAIEAKKNGPILSLLVIERDLELGGILQQCIHNGFGLHVFKEELTGPEYAERFIEELKSMGIEYLLDTMVLEVTPDRRVYALNSEKGLMVQEAGAVILAMGCRERTAGAILVPGTRPSGVMTAGTAQRLMNIEGYKVGKRVVILGSGDIGLIMARRLTLEGVKVLAVAEILPFSSGLTRNIVQCLEDFDIPLYLNHTVVEIKGKERVEGVVIAQVDGKRQRVPGTEITYDCDTLLLSVGLIPENELTRGGGIEIDPKTSGPRVHETMETSLEGIFACGNVVHVHDLVDYVTEESRRAGKGAACYVQGLLTQEGIPIQTIPGVGVSYIVPQWIRPENLEEKLDLFLRVQNVHKEAMLLIKLGGALYRKIKKSHVAPGEMIHLEIPKEALLLKGLSLLSVELEVAP